MAIFRIEKEKRVERSKSFRGNWKGTLKCIPRGRWAQWQGLEAHCRHGGRFGDSWLFFLSLWVESSSFFVCLVVLDWMPNIVNFTLLSTREFFFFFFSGAWWSYIEIVWSFWVLLSFIRWDQSCFYLGLFFPHCRGNIILSSLPGALWMWKFTLWLMGTRVLLSPVWTLGIVLSAPL